MIGALFRNNPEFTKNVKLEFSSIRIAIPVILLLLTIWLGWSAEDGVHEWKNQYTLEQQKAKGMFNGLCAFGFLFAIIWGSYLTSNSLIEEIRGKTWDFVRMSSLSPMKILIGKVFGTTSVIWVVSVLGGLPAMLYAGALMIPGDGIIRPEVVTISVFALILVCWMILSYTTPLLLELSNDGDKGKRSGAFSSTLLVFFIGTTFGGMIIKLFEDFARIEKYGAAPGYKGKSIALPLGATVIEPNFSFMRTPDMSDWYSFTMFSFDLLLAVMLFFTFWAFIGAWRALRKSLQYRDAPYAWIGFIATASLFLNGFTDDEFRELRNLQGILFWPIAISLVTMCFACIKEAGNIIQYRAFAENIGQGKYYEAFRGMPLWIISFIAFAVSLFISLLTVKNAEHGMLFFFSLMGFVVRDLLVFHAISWSSNIRRPFVAMAVYGVIAYTLLPAVLGAAHSESAGLFFPLVKDNGLSGYWILLAVEIVIAAYFFIKRWKTAFGTK